MSYQKLIKNSFLYTLGSILPQLVGFILLPVYTSYLDPDQYGIVNAMTVLSGVVGILLLLGIDRGIFRLYYDYEQEERKIYLGTILIGLTFIAISFFLIITFIPSIISFTYKSIPYYPYYFLTVLSVVVTKIAAVPSIYLRISEQATKYVSLSVLSFILTVFFNLLFVIYYKEGAVGMLKGPVYASMITGPIYFILTYDAFTLKFKTKYFIESIKFSLPLLPSLIFAWILNLSDRVFLERYLSLSDVGIYSLGYKIASVVIIISGGLYTAYNPHFYKLASEKTEDVKLKIKKYNNFITILILSSSFLIIFFAKEVFQIVIPAKYYAALSIIPIITVGIFFSQITGLLNLMIYQEKKSLQIMTITFAGACINVVSNLILIPRVGMMGAAISTLISFVGLFAIEYWYARKCYFIPYEWKSIIVSSLVFFTVYFITEQINPGHVYLSLIFKLMITVSILFYFYTKNKSLVRTLLNI